MKGEQLEAVAVVAATSQSLLESRPMIDRAVLPIVFFGFRLNPGRNIGGQPPPPFRPKVEILCAKTRNVPLVRGQLFIGRAEAGGLNRGPALERRKQRGIESLSTLPALDLRAPDIVGLRILKIVELVRNQLVVENRRASHARKEHQSREANLDAQIPLESENHEPGIGPGKGKVERRPASVEKPVAGGASAVNHHVLRVAGAHEAEKHNEEENHHRNPAHDVEP